MRKLITISFLLSLSALVSALPVDRLNISIQNASSADCVLKRQYSVLGHISDHTKVPEVIFKDQTAAFKMRSDKTHLLHGTMAAILNYQCGTDQEITLSFILAKHAFKCQVFDAKNMQASATKEASSFSEPWKIHWVLTY